MNLLLERLGIQLPQYHNAKFDRFWIETKPYTFLRKWFPYFVGNKITFLMRIEDTEQRLDSTTLYVVELFGDRQETVYKTIAINLPKEWITIIGNPIDREGDVIYKLGVAPSASNAKTLLSAHAINTDRWSLGCVGLLAGFIVAVASGIVLGFIKVEPIVRMFINP